MKKTIVTLIIGSKYEDLWTRNASAGWRAYCERHNYDLIAIRQTLDSSDRARRRSPAWQKCLILSQPWASNYGRIVWIDSDIAINPVAPSIIEDVPEQEIGIIDEAAYPNVADHQAAVHYFLRENAKFRDPEIFHTCVGLPGGQRHIVQSGVMVLSPRYHRSVLEHVYNSYNEDTGPSDLYEMRFLSHEIQKGNLQHWIDRRFNAMLIWLGVLLALKRHGVPLSHEELRNFLKEQYLSNYFLHFAGYHHLLENWPIIIQK